MNASAGWCCHLVEKSDSHFRRLSVFLRQNGGKTEGQNKSYCPVQTKNGGFLLNHSTARLACRRSRFPLTSNENYRSHRVLGSPLLRFPNSPRDSARTLSHVEARTQTSLVRVTRCPSGVGRCAASWRNLALSWMTKIQSIGSFSHVPLDHTKAFKWLTKSSKYN